MSRQARIRATSVAALALAVAGPAAAQTGYYPQTYGAPYAPSYASPAPAAAPYADPLVGRVVSVSEPHYLDQAPVASQSAQVLPANTPSYAYAQPSGSSTYLGGYDYGSTTSAPQTYDYGASSYAQPSSSSYSYAQPSTSSYSYTQPSAPSYPSYPQPSTPSYTYTQPAAPAPSYTPSPAPGYGPGVVAGAHYVQVGAFTRPANAERLVRQLSAYGEQAFVEPAQVRGATWYRVRVGPILDQGQGWATLNRIRSLGHRDARLVRS